MQLSELGQLLRERREALGMQAKDVAQHARISAGYLSMLESATNPKTRRPARPSREKLMRLAVSLKLDPARVLAMADYVADDVATDSIGAEDMPLGGLMRARGTLAQNPLPSPPLDEWLLSPPARFFGRDEERGWLRQRLLLRDVDDMTALHGFGGIGKSALAATVVHDLRREEHFRDGIAVIRCEDFRTASEILSHVLSRFHPNREQSNAHQPDVLAAIARRLLYGKDALIVLEDIAPHSRLAEGGRLLEGVVRPLRALGPRLLLIARQTLPSEIAVPSASLLLDVLDEQSAIEMFAHAMGRTPPHERDRDIIAQLVTALERHPLAIKLAGAYAREAGRDLRSLAIELQVPGRVLALYGNADDAAPTSVRRVLLQQLEVLPPPARKLFGALCAFRTNSFSRNAAIALTGAIETGDGAAKCPINDEKWLNLLISDALLEPATNDGMALGTDRERLRLHTLLRALSEDEWRQLREDERQRAYEALARYYAAYVRRVIRIDFSSHRQCGALGVDEGNLAGALEWAHECGKLEIVVALCRGLYQFWLRRWHSDASLGYLRWGVTAAQALAEESGAHDAQLDTQMAVHELLLAYGEALRRAGQLREAEQALNDYHTFIQRMDTNRPSEAYALYLRGKLARAMGRTKEAEEALQRSLEIFRAEGQIETQAEVLTYLGRLAQERGNIHQAETYLRTCYDLALEAGDFRSIAAVLAHFGQIEHARCNYDMAEVWFTESLSQYQSDEIHDRHHEGRVLTSLAVLAMDRSDWSTAEQCLEQALRIDREVGDKPGQGVDLAQLGRLGIYKGQLEQAERTLQNALEIAESVEDRRNQGVCSALLGRVAFERKDDACATAYFQKAIAIAQEVGNRWGEGMNYYYLALIAERGNDIASAESNFERGYEIAFHVANTRGLVECALAWAAYLIKNKRDTERGHQLVQLARDIIEEKGLTATIPAHVLAEEKEDILSENSVHGSRPSLMPPTTALPLPRT